MLLLEKEVQVMRDHRNPTSAAIVELEAAYWSFPVRILQPIILSRGLRRSGRKSERIQSLLDYWHNNREQFNCEDLKGLKRVETVGEQLRRNLTWRLLKYWHQGKDIMTQLDFLRNPKEGYTLQLERRFKILASLRVRQQRLSVEEVSSSLFQPKLPPSLSFAVAATLLLGSLGTRVYERRSKWIKNFIQKQNMCRGMLCFHPRRRLALLLQVRSDKRGGPIILITPSLCLRVCFSRV